MHALLSWFSLPEIGLGAVFLISLLASTLLPLGSEPALLAFVALSPAAVWPAIGVATLGNSLGGVITYWMGAGAWHALHRREQHGPHALRATPAPGRWQRRAQELAQRFGAPVLFFSWLPLVGDPLCGVAGWMRLPFWSCLLYITLGKLARYLLICGAFLHFWS